MASHTKAWAETAAEAGAGTAAPESDSVASTEQSAWIAYALAGAAAVAVGAAA